MQYGFRWLSEEFYEICTQKHQGEANTKIELFKLDLIFKVTKAVQNGIHSICEEIYMTYPYQIWYTKATGQGKRLVKFLKVALSYSGGVTPTVAIKPAHF